MKTGKANRQKTSIKIRLELIPNKSYATSFPNDGSIYLEKVYAKDESGNIQLVEHSNGILIAKDQYISIEIYSIGGNYE